MKEQMPFYGRYDELERLELLLKKKTSSMVVIKGRRRIGKSRLIHEFCKNRTSFFFTGLPPDEFTTDQTQRDYFVWQMEKFFGVREINTTEWADILWHLAREVADKKAIVVFDEINWIGSYDHTYLGKLKSAWDVHLKNNPELVLILSGSMSIWIDENILSSTGFMGRISLELTLDELPLPICNLFWRNKADAISDGEKFKVLSVTGGVPRYLEEIDPNLSAEKNIFNLAFKRGGLLVTEFDRIFADLFSKRSKRYKQIVERLVDGSASIEQISMAIDMEKGGSLSEYLEDLVEIGYIARDVTWNIKQGSVSKLSKYRLKDNYLRFYLKYIEPQRPRIEKDLVTTLPAWTTIMGLQFENLVVNNAHCVYSALGINTDHIVFSNPYFQRPTAVKRGCQIDFMIQDKFNTLYVCEIKFEKGPVGIAVIDDIKQKIAVLSTPKNFSIRPVLIHVNDVSEAVTEADYFANIIEFGTFLCDIRCAR